MSSHILIIITPQLQTKCLPFGCNVRAALVTVKYGDTFVKRVQTASYEAELLLGSQMLWFASLFLPAAGIRISPLPLQCFQQQLSYHRKSNLAFFFFYGAMFEREIHCVMYCKVKKKKHLPIAICHSHITFGGVRVMLWGSISFTGIAIRFVFNGG